MSELLPIANATQSRRSVFALLRLDRRRAYLALFLLVVGLGASMVSPRVLGYIIDSVLQRQPVTTLVPPFLILLAIAIFQGAFTAAGMSLIAAVGERLAARLREKVVDRALRIPLQRVESAGGGDLMARVNEDMSIVSAAVGEVIPLVLTAALTMLLTFVSLFVLDWRLALAALLCSPPQILAVRWLLRIALPMQRKEREASSRRSQSFLESVDGADVVRAFGLGTVRERQFSTQSRESMHWALQMSRFATQFYGKLNVGELLGLSAVLVAGFFLVQSHSITIGVASAAALYFHRLFDPFNQLLGQFHEAQGALVATARIVGVAEMELPPAPANPQQPKDASLSLRGVWHEYSPGHRVLHDIDLDIAAGRRIALVGPSGAGKTTIAGLIAGVHTASGGRIELGQAALENLDADTLARTVTLISQEDHVFAGTLADDLRLAAPDADDATVTGALETVGALGWVKALPDGIETVVGDGGRSLSTTQVQQLALARLVLADPPIAILDEATAEAGSTGARELERAADAALAGRTALIVAHRLTQAINADEVIVLVAGRIAERGTHDELVALGGEYARLWSAWSAARVG